MNEDESEGGVGGGIEGKGGRGWTDLHTILSLSSLYPHFALTLFLI